MGLGFRQFMLAEGEGEVGEETGKAHMGATGGRLEAASLKL
jgi:hypothetical protein